MKGMIKVSAAVLAVAMLAGGISETAYARGGHHDKNACTTEYAACYQDGVCLEDGSCDVDGVCQYGGSCTEYEDHVEVYRRNGRGHHSRHSHGSGCHR